MKLFLLFCFCCIFQQQVLSQSPPLARSTTSASGSSDIVVNGDNTYVIQQSVGQPSAIGTYNSKYTVRQGFIQPNVMAIIKDVNVPINLQINLYPNPFDEQISLVFNEEIKGEIKITVYNILGAQMFSQGYEANQQIDVLLGWLSSGEYILKVNANQKQFISKILKK